MSHLLGHRSLVIALAAGMAAAVAVPQLVAAGPPEQVWPTDLHPASGIPATVSDLDHVAPAADDVPGHLPAPAPVASDPAPPAPVTEQVPAAPTPVAPPAAPVAPGPPEAAPAAPLVVEEDAAVDEASTTGTVTVDAVPTEGATRHVTVQAADGTRAAGPVTVTGETIVLELPAGVYDLMVEQFFDGGGTFLTRVRFTLDPGGSVYAACDAETLDCTVVAS